jgi:hypothetical protein
MDDETVLHRYYQTQLAEGDGRTIVGRCVPYDVAATVADTPGGPTYRELFRHGAFTRAARAPSRVMLVYGHRDSLGDLIGPAVELTERDDGLYGAFRAAHGPIGDHALDLVRSGALGGLSVAIVPNPRTGSRQLQDGTIERTKVRLAHVALVSEPAYADALVTGTRAADEGAPSERLAGILARTDELRARWDRSPHPES